MKNKLLKIVSTTAIIGTLGYGVNSFISADYKTIQKNLDSDAVTINEFEIPNNRNVWIKYKDIDKDGDFDSYLLWKNQDGNKIEIQIQKSKENYSYPTLDQKAIKPHYALKNGLEVEYTTPKLSGKLESRIISSKK